MNLTHSRLSCLQACPKRYFFQYVIGVRKRRDFDEPISIGRIFHELLETGSVVKPPNPGYTDEEKQMFDLIWAKAICMYEGYINYWKDDNITITKREIEFQIPILNPRTGRKARKAMLAGKIDAIGTWCSRTIIMETKTTGESLAPDGDYWKRLRMDQQITIYMLGYPEAETIIYDVIKRPTIRPREKVYHCPGCAQERAAGLKECGCGNTDKERDVAPETVTEYQERLRVDIAERPEFYYCRQEIPRLDADLEQFRKELWYKQRVLAERVKHGYWDRDTSACQRPWRCEYLDYCQGGFDDDVLPNGFYRAFGNEELRDAK